MSDELELQDKPIIFKNKRYMAWVSLFSLIGILLWVFWNNEISSAQENLLIALMWPFAAIVGAYMGFKMVERIRGKDTND